MYQLHSENSVRNLRAIIDGLLNLAQAERRGDYPGGRKVRAFIGRSLAFALDAGGAAAWRYA